MLNIDVKFSGNTKERIEALINGFDKKRGVLMGKIAKRMEVDLRNKFLSNGGRSFWQYAASSIFKSNTDTKASVVVNKPGVALQYYGGTVRPKKARNLAIPMREKYTCMFTYGNVLKSGGSYSRLQGSYSGISVRRKCVLNKIIIFDAQAALIDEKSLNRLNRELRDAQK